MSVITGVSMGLSAAPLAALSAVRPALSRLRGLS